VAARLGFEWDNRKAAANLREHGVSFEEASTAFYDDGALLIDDPDHSVSEERFVLLGMSAALRVLVIPHCYRRRGTSIRIISAWKGGRREQSAYFERVKK
jgi:uncharacterized DUF497 family protein